MCMIAFTDPEIRYRQRYVDLVVNSYVKDAFVKRTKMYSSMREYLNAKGYLEVENPHFATALWRSCGTSVQNASQYPRYDPLLADCE